MRMARIWCLLAVAVSLLIDTSNSLAVELQMLEVDTKDGTFEIRADSLLSASPAFIYAILLDYDNFHRLAGGISETRFLPPDEQGTLMGYTRIDSCVWFFCRKIERIERIFTIPGQEISTVAIPQRSDFEVYRTRWVIEPAGPGSTRLHFEATMKPDFWIPPLIGPWAIRRKLQRTAERVGTRIEYLYANGLSITALPEYQ
ncbi:MAG TPA: hypothetical protein ENK16_05985 [Chromatiales bacterium]|nr:hypothetical protein [Chromatiales bacterium]